MQHMAAAPVPPLLVGPEHVRQPASSGSRVDQLEVVQPRGRFEAAPFGGFGRSLVLKGHVLMLSGGQENHTSHHAGCFANGCDHVCTAYTNPCLAEQEERVCAMLYASTRCCCCLSWAAQHQLFPGSCTAGALQFVVVVGWIQPAACTACDWSWSWTTCTLLAKARGACSSRSWGESQLPSGTLCVWRHPVCIRGYDPGLLAGLCPGGWWHVLRRARLCSGCVTVPVLCTWLQQQHSCELLVFPSHGVQRGRTGIMGLLLCAWKRRS